MTQIFEILYNVKDILYKKGAHDGFAEFMQKLKTDAISLQSPDNAIRKVYEGFKIGMPQKWHLIDADEYASISEEGDASRIVDWVAKAKENVLQFAANSYLCSGPTLEQESENSQGQNLHALLWYNLTGDEEIPYRPHQCGNNSPAERAFFDNYWRPFTNYIGTRYGDGAETFETDSPLDGFFNIIADFEKNRNNPKKLLEALDRLVNLRHQRGTLAHLFVNNGKMSEK